MFFELFLSEYKDRVFKNILFSEISSEEIPLYRKLLFLLFFIIFLLLNYKFGWLTDLSYNWTLILFFILIIVTKIFDSTKNNKAKWEEIKKNVLKRNIAILNEVLEKYDIKEEKQINYIIDEATKYKNKYSLKEFFKTPIIFFTIFTSFFLPKIQTMINEKVPDKQFLLILFLYIILSAWIYTIYNLFRILFNTKYEVCNKLIKDLNFISSFKRFEYK